jgi:hypothetical protein
MNPKNIAAKDADYEIAEILGVECDTKSYSVPSKWKVAVCPSS